MVKLRVNNNDQKLSASLTPEQTTGGLGVDLWKDHAPLKKSDFKILYKTRLFAMFIACLKFWIWFEWMFVHVEGRVLKNKTEYYWWLVRLRIAKIPVAADVPCLISDAHLFLFRNKVNC